MAASSVIRRASLEDPRPYFSLSFLKDAEISLKSRQQGLKYFAEGYLHDVGMFWSPDFDILDSTNSARINEARRVSIDIKLDILNPSPKLEPKTKSK